MKLPLAPLILLAGCGPSLGEYAVTDVRLVDTSEVNAIEPHRARYGSSKDFLRIEFKSQTNLADVTGRSGDFYAKGDFCPFRSVRFFANGPYFDDRSRYGSPKKITQKNPDGSTRQIVIERDPQPVLDPSSGLYTYTAYLALSGKDSDDEDGYDLKTDDKDVCLRISQPGYYVTGGTSDVFVVPRKTISEALHAGSPSK